MAIRYLGSKARVLSNLARLIGEPRSKEGRFVDAFSGTGVVGSIAADLGWGVHLNDHLRCARLLSGARMISEAEVPYTTLGGYQGAVTKLNGSLPTKGFLWREYSPASAEHAPRPRQYFTEDNAARLDGMRAQIHLWSAMGAISEVEEDLLLADLIEAASAVANTAGTFGCFMSGWLSTALRTVQVRERELRSKPIRFTAEEVDVFSVRTEVGDTVYLDPPYTKRQYAAYYHVLETLAHGDEPEVSGVTGLRPWESKASPFCYKSRALFTMLRLIEHIRAERILISYSVDGHIELEDLVRGLEQSGTVETHRIGGVPRYQSNQSNGSADHYVDEFVIVFRHKESE